MNTDNNGDNVDDMASPPYHPHDNLFKGMMEQPAVARAFFNAWLPEDVKAVCDLDTLQQQPVEFIQGSEGAGECDVLFSVQSKKGVIYLLVEHQSGPKKNMERRMADYMIQIGLRHRKQSGDEHFPLICPILVYHGRRTPYPYSYVPDMNSLFYDPQWMKERFKRPVLIDYTIIPDEQLMTHKEAAAAELAIKNAFMPANEDDKLVAFLVCYTRLKAQCPDSIFTQGLAYWLECNKISNDRLKTLINRLSEPEKEEIMYTADTVVGSAVLRGRQQGIIDGIQQGMQKGRLEGMQQGMQKGRLEIVANLLQSGMSAGQVAECARLDMKEVESVAETIRRRSDQQNDREDDCGMGL